MAKIPVYISELRLTVYADENEPISKVRERYLNKPSLNPTKTPGWKQREINDKFNHKNDDVYEMLGGGKIHDKYNSYHKNRRK